MTIYCLAALFVLLLASGANAKEKVDPRQKLVEKVFVVGNSSSANDVRKALTDLRGNTHWKAICISGVTNKEDADTLLEIVESVPLGEWKDGTVRLPQSAATLTLKSGDVIWSNDSQYSSVFILKRLNEAVCRAAGLK
jgi:hypothetical protein